MIRVRGRISKAPRVVLQARLEEGVHASCEHLCSTGRSGEGARGKVLCLRVSFYASDQDFPVCWFGLYRRITVVTRGPVCRLTRVGKE